MKSLFIIDKAGTVLIEKHYGEKIQRSELEPICVAIRDSPPPIIDSFGTVFLLHETCGIFIVGACISEEMSFHVASQLVQIGETLNSCLKNGLDVESVKTEYSFIYRIFDLSVNSGYPFLDERNVMEAAEANHEKLGFDPKYPWRVPQSYKGPGEIYVSVEEAIHARINGVGKSDLMLVTGSVKIKSKLAGFPKCQLSISTPHKIDDFSFHRCVDPEQYLAKKWTFVPPDGDFTLMTYTARPELANLPVFVAPKFMWSKVGVVFEISVRLDESLSKLTDVQLSFDLPHGMSTPSLATACGSVDFDMDHRKVKWNIDNVRKELLVLNGSASLENSFMPEACDLSIHASFSAAGYSASGLKVEALEVEGNSKAMKAVKYVTCGGQYVFSCHE